MTNKQSQTCLQITIQKINSWNGLSDAAPAMMTKLKIPLDEKNHLPFTLTDAGYKVILAGGMYQPGDVLLTLDQGRSLTHHLQWYECGLSGYPFSDASSSSSQRLVHSKDADQPDYYWVGCGITFPRT